MKYSPISRNSINISEVLEDLRRAEVCLDFPRFQEIFSFLNWEIAEEPDFSEFGELTEAQLLRHSGYFLSHFGFAKNLLSYQERGKDLLTRAIRRFEKLNLKSAAIEAQIHLATAYWFEAGFDEAEIIHQISESQLEEENQLYLLLQVNTLLVACKKKNYKFALEKVKKIEKLIDFSDDLTLRSKFHIEAGLVYRATGNLEKAEENYSLSLTFTRAVKIPLREAQILNNLAFLNLKLERFDLALSYAEESLNILKRLGHKGWIPHILDTKAQIYFAMKDYEMARDYIHEAIMYFRDGEDYAGRCDALMLEAKIFFKMELREYGLASFRECYEVAQNRLGKSSAEDYEKELLSLIYVNSGDNFDEQVENYIRYLLEGVFLQTDSITDAAQILGFSNPQRLRALLKAKYPEFFDYFNLNKKIVKTVKSTKIEKIDFSFEFEFDFDVQIKGLQFYRLPANHQFGEMIAVAKNAEISQNSFVIFFDEEIKIGKLAYVKSNWLIEEFNSNKIFKTNEVKFLGEIVAIGSNKKFKKVG